MNSLNNLKRNMATTPKVVLLACGSFNPITNMHLRLFELGRDALNRTGRFNVVGGIISPVNDAYKKKDLASSNDRCNMVRQAVKNADWIRLDTWESEQPAWLETAKVMTHHHGMLQNHFNGNCKPASGKRRKKSHHVIEDVDNAADRSNESDDPPVLKLLCGADLLESFGTPGLWADEDIETIVGKHGLVCISRAGSDPEKFIYESDVLTKHRENIFIVTEWITNDISATKVRRALRRGESIRYLLPDPVIDYIKEHRLYGTHHQNNQTTNQKTEEEIEDDDDEGIMSPDLGPEEEMMIISSSSSGEALASPSSGEAPSVYRCSDGSSSSLGDEDILEQRQQPIRRPDPPQLPPRVATRARPPAVAHTTQTACMTDIGTLMRRVKNYNLRLFQPNNTNTHQK